VIEVARLVFERLAIAHVAHERLDAHLAGRSEDGRAGCHFNPDHLVVGAAQAEQVVGDRAVAREAIDEHRARALVGEAVGLERRSDASGVSAG